MKSRVLAAILVSLGAVCGAAQAQSQVIAYASVSANVFAGPSEDYPVVAVLAPGAQVAVQGCLPDYTWCDVIAGYERGWVYAGAISYPYENTWQPMIAFAPVLGIAVVPFVFAEYWPRHYWNRPFFADRARWWNVPHAGFRHHPGPAPVAGWRHQPPPGRVGAPQRMGPPVRMAPPVRVGPPVQPIAGVRPMPAAPRSVPQQPAVRPAPHGGGGAVAPARGGWNGSGGGGHGNWSGSGGRGHGGWSGGWSGGHGHR